MSRCFSSKFVKSTKNSRKKNIGLVQSYRAIKIASSNFRLQKKNNENNKLVENLKLEGIRLVET